MSTSTWTWPGSRVGRVIDGDSFQATVRRTITADVGFEQTLDLTVAFPIKLRLNRINAPAAGTPTGDAATARVHQLVDGAELLIETLKTYKYGGGETPEWMAEVTLPDGRDLSDVLVAEGHAVYWDGHGPRPNDG